MNNTHTAIIANIASTVTNASILNDIEHCNTEWTLEQREIFAFIYDALLKFKFKWYCVFDNPYKRFNDLYNLAFYNHGYLKLDEKEIQDLKNRCNWHLYKIALFVNHNEDDDDDDDDDDEKLIRYAKIDDPYLSAINMQLKTMYAPIVILCDGVETKPTSNLGIIHTLIFRYWSNKNFIQSGPSLRYHYVYGGVNGKKSRLRYIYENSFDARLIESYREIVKMYDFHKYPRGNEHFNEQSNDIIIFGFGQGAALARALCGLIHWCGIINCDIYPEVNNLVNEYTKYTECRKNNRPIPAFETTALYHEYVVKGKYRHHPKVTIKFLGVFDSVHGMGDGMYKYNLYCNDSIESSCHIMAKNVKKHYVNMSLHRDMNYSTEKHREIYYPGTHFNIGGMIDGDGIGDETLKMMLRASPLSASADWLDTIPNIREVLPTYKADQPKST